MWPFSPSTDRFSAPSPFRRAELGARLPATILRLVGEPSLAGLRVLNLGFSRQDRIVLSETQHGLGAREVAASEEVYPIGLGKPGSLRYDGIVVNLDRFADTEMGVDRLMRFRRASPGTFIVMATAGVASDDFGHHRRAICDSTLRLPLTPSRLNEALMAALENHRSHQN